jgi:hypothetical protein
MCESFNDRHKQHEAIISVMTAKQAKGDKLYEGLSNKVRGFERAV